MCHIQHMAQLSGLVINLYLREAEQKCLVLLTCIFFVSDLGSFFQTRNFSQCSQSQRFKEPVMQMGTVNIQEFPKVFCSLSALEEKKRKLLFSEALFNFFVCSSFSFRSFLPIYFVKYATFTLIRVQHVSALQESLTSSSCLKLSLDFPGISFSSNVADLLQTASVT